MIRKGLFILMLFVSIAEVLAIDPGDIGKINKAKADARKAYLAGDFKTAAARYKYLVDSIGVTEDEVRMNLANSYFNLNDTTSAVQAFQPLTLSPNSQLKSVANQQLGVLHNREGKFEEALAFFKAALKADPKNEDARFNYEMVKKKLAEQKKKEDQNKDKNKDQNKDQEKKDQEQKDKEEKDKENKDKENKDQKDQKDKDQQKKEQEEKEKKEQEQKEKEQKEQEEKEQKEKKDKQDIPQSVKDKLKDMNMSEDKAKMILEAMKNQEVQYLQQNKRKATQTRDKSKPDW